MAGEDSRIAPHRKFYVGTSVSVMVEAVPTAVAAVSRVFHRSHCSGGLPGSIKWFARFDFAATDFACVRRLGNRESQREEDCASRCGSLPCETRI